jgi:putative alpha-1,2-mannosidase
MQRKLFISFSLLIGFLSLHAIADDAQKPSPHVQPGRLGKEVNPFIGTGGLAHLCANNFPGAAVPFGMVRLSPDTISAQGRKATNYSGYFYSDPRLLGFSHTRLAGTGATDGGKFLVIPCTADTAKSLLETLSQKRGEDGRSSDVVKAWRVTEPVA